MPNITAQDLFKIYGQCIEEQWTRGPQMPPVQAVYESITAKLNAQYLAPLQGDLAQLRADFQRLKVMDGDIQKEQDAEMSQLQRENDALKALLTSFRVYVKDAPLAFVSNGWEQERFHLLSATSSLLGAEQKG